MRAIQVRQPGGPAALDTVELDTPTPSNGEVLVRVAASGVNFIDTYQRSGLYEMPTPFTPGSEGAGTVTAVGDGVDDVAVGDRVGWAMAPGSYAEQALVPTSKLVRLPGGIDDQTAAASLLQGMTAHYLVNSTFQVATGHTALVHAAAGGMGLLLTQWIKAKGGIVVGTVSTDEKAKLATGAGVDEIIRYDRDDVAEQIRDLTDGRGVDVVYDGVGKATFDASLACLRPRGTLALYGAASGPVPPLDPQRLNSAGSVFLTRPTLAHHLLSREELDWRSGDLFSAIASGVLRIRVGGTYPLAEAARAHEDLEDRRTTGSLLLLP